MDAGQVVVDPGDPRRIPGDVADAQILQVQEEGHAHHWPLVRVSCALDPERTLGVLDDRVLESAIVVALDVLDLAVSRRVCTLPAQVLVGVLQAGLRLILARFSAFDPANQALLQSHESRKGSLPALMPADT